jgi:hypothetical protein
MSVHQMLCHLADGFRMATGELPVRRTGRWLPRGAIKWVALYAPLRWARGLPTSPELDQMGRYATRPAEFAADRARVERLMADVALAPRELGWPPHPLFGAMSRGDWMRWGYRHVDHHLRQFGR